MTQPLLKIILNWANEGDTPDTVDLTSETVQTQISRGRNIIQDLYEVGAASFKVVDPNGDWNPQNIASPYAGKVYPLRKVSMFATWLGIDYPIFTGFTMTYDYTYPKDQAFGYVVIKCEDAFRLFNMAAVKTVAGGVAGQTTGQRINSILDQIGWSATDRDIDAGLTLCLADPGTVRPALQALRTVEFSEGLGAFYMSADGKATFKNRQNTIIGFAPRTTHTNFIKNPSYDQSTVTWTPSNANYTIAKDDTNSFLGSSSLLITCLAAGGNNGGAASRRVGGTSGRVVVTGGDVLNLSAFFKTITGTRQMGLSVTYFSTLTGATPIGSTVLSTGIAASSSFQKATLTTTVPSGVGIQFASIGLIHRTTGSIGDSFCVDAVMLEINATLLSPFPFDGNISNFPTNYSANLAWTGTQYESASTASYLTYPDPTTFDQGTGINYQNLTYALDDKLLVNEATFTRIGGTAQTHTDATSVAKYFVHSISKPDLLMDTDDLALDLAQAYVAGRQDTEIRIENLTLMLNGVTDSNDMISIIEIDYFDKVQITNNQPGGSTITQTLFVQGLSHDITPNRWVTTIKTYESLLDGLVLNDSVKGTLDYNVLGY